MNLPEAKARAERHALAVLEFPRVLEKVAGHATSGPGRAVVLALRPSREEEAVARALGEVHEMVGFLLRLERWSPPGIPDIEGELRAAAVEGGALDTDQLAKVLVLLRSSRVVRADLRRFPDDLPLLVALSERLVRLPELESLLDRSLVPSGGLSDSASPELGRLRKSLRGSRSTLVRRLERYVRQLPDRLQVADGSVTLRSGRYCVPVRREGMSYVGGIVHDESATHRTLFVEPPLAVEAMNRIAEQERAEVREEQRVLRELTAALRPVAGELLESLGTLARTDGLYARARYALSHGGSRPAVSKPRTGSVGPSYRVVDARHPLLEADGEPAVPYHLDLASDERVLLISGPNAGGKTVLLKAVGLLSVMAQSGIIPPAGEGTRLPLFESFHAIIGDEQSIQASLSTFSAQVEGLRLILEMANRGSLVLIDELGGNTDPAEGGALAAAVVLRLADQAGLSVVTTHLGELKDLAAQQAGIVNASLQFDAEAMRPTFRLVRDRPGRSYALEIARRLGLPDVVLSVARSRLRGGQRRIDALLADLETRSAESDRLAAEARRAAQRSREAERRLERSEEILEQRERMIEREARERVERYLLEARREVEAEVRRLRAVAENASSDSVGDGGLDSAVRGARSRVEQLLRETRALEQPEVEAAPPRGPLVVGGGARSRSLDLEGEVLEVRATDAVVEAGGVRFTLNLTDLEPAARPARGRPSGHAPPMPDIAAATEVDLRGLRVDEVGTAVAQAVDAAIFNDVPSLRIIHGKGTGALRTEVSRILDTDDRIRSHRPGGFQEGGSGVTVVEFTNVVD